MPTFQYEAVNAAGQAVRDNVEAATQAEAVAKIKMQGHYPTRVKETRSAPPVPAPQGIGRAARPGRRQLFPGRVSAARLTEFTLQLSTLQDAGLPIVRSLNILHQQEKHGTLKHTLAEVVGSVEDGATLSEAMARHPNVFDPLYINMVRAGETGGVLDVILQRLADFMEKAQRLRRRVIGAMIYPAVVISFSVIIVMGIMVFVVPRFQDIFRDFRASIPRLTTALIWTADILAHHFGWALILALPVTAHLLLKLIRGSARGRHALDAATLHLPVIGRIVRKTAVARFTRTLGTLLGAGVPILDAINIVRDTVGNTVFSRALAHVHKAIREGESFAGPLRAQHVCDSIVTNMIDVGEETGDLDKMLLKIADTHDEQVNVLVGSLVSLLEPVMVMVLGGIVGTIVLALFLPIFGILQKITNSDGQ